MCSCAGKTTGDPGQKPGARCTVGAREMPHPATRVSPTWVAPRLEAFQMLAFPRGGGGGPLASSSLLEGG